ncbi:MAG TPA: sigma-54 dependent transcriptional regulator [Treponemataceae bacterium]|nr:sigma-54 dependent transcriptional regulator [Treponemataceae bacterium]
MNDARILIIDDERNLRNSLAEYLALEGFRCSGAANGEEGLALLERELFSAVLLDLRMPGMDGLEVLDRIRTGGPGLPVIIMSAHGDINDAVSAMKKGADDYVVKPFDPGELAVRLEKALEKNRLLRLADVGRRLYDEPASRGGADGSRWLGDDPAMHSVVTLVRKASPSSATVLVTGESGTGKEVIARELHRQSPRSGGPFVPVNVGAIPESLQESELFGFEKGSFTGADRSKQGLFELASGGTLFLDELGEMSPSLQVKLLRVLQERVVVRVGGTRPIPVDVRVVAATNRDLEEAVRAGAFREDLYFRVNVIRIHIPPLRERPLDIAPLAGMFLARFSRETGKKISGISPAALKLLTEYPFPGNVRELENAMERAVILAEGDELGPADFTLSSRLRPPPAGSAAAESAAASAAASAPAAPASLAAPAVQSEVLSVREAERQAIVSALAVTGGHREKTASELGISRRTLLNKMREYGLLGKD